MKGLIPLPEWVVLHVLIDTAQCLGMDEEVIKLKKRLVRLQSPDQLSHD